MPGTKHLTYHLGGGYDSDGSYYPLLRDGKILYLQADPVVSPEYDPEPHVTDSNRAERIRAIDNYDGFLSTIQTLLDEIEFDRGDWAYLLREDDGSFRLAYKNRPALLTKNIWAPLIDEKDIAITCNRWSMMDYREGQCYSLCGSVWIFKLSYIPKGLWNGREVDVYEPVMPSWASLVDAQSMGHMIMQRQGLKDMTFEILGHLVRDGVLVGNVFEPCHGRLIEFSDRGVVYAAIARLQQSNIIYRALHTKEIFITESGVRFGPGLSSVIFVSDKEELEWKAEYWHWGQLKQIFDELKLAPNSTFTSRKTTSMEVLLPRLPAPSRPLSSIPGFSNAAFALAAFIADPANFYGWLAKVTSFPSESQSLVRNKKRPTAPLDISFMKGRRKARIELSAKEPLPLSSRHISRVEARFPSLHKSYPRYNSNRGIRDNISDTSDSTL